MKKPLSRGMARLVLIELVFSAACLVLDQLIPYHTMGEYRVVDALYYFKRSLQLLPCALLGSAAVCWIRNLRCPYCERGIRHALVAEGGAALLLPLRQGDRL